jgi:hypothetical protein
MTARPDDEVLRRVYEAWKADERDTNIVWRSTEEAPMVLSPGLRDALDALVAAVDDPAEQHLIEFRPDGWTIQHTLACRVRGELFSCPVDTAAQALDGPPGQLGRFPAAERNGHLIIDFESGAGR